MRENPGGKITDVSIVEKFKVVESDMPAYSLPAVSVKALESIWIK